MVKAWRDATGKPDEYTNRHPKDHPSTLPPKNVTTGWRPTCSHDADPIPAVVFDPFVGSGTTVAVAQQLGRRGVGIDLSMPYLHLARERTGAAAMSEWMEGAHENARKNGKESGLEGLPLFQEI